MVDLVVTLGNYIVSGLIPGFMASWNAGVFFEDTRLGVENYLESFATTKNWID